LFPGFAKRYDPSAVGYDEDYPSMKNQTFIGRYLDRRFLNSLDKPVWDSVVNLIKTKLTDDVIKEALLNMPEEMFQLRGNDLFNTLNARRDKLNEAANEFYELLYKIADVYGTNESEYCKVNRLNNEEVEVVIYLRDANTGQQLGEPVFRRTYNSDTTDEIRLYLLNGNNKVVVEGKVNNSILVRIIGGNDKDELIDNSKVNGYFLGCTPIPDAETMTEFYDCGKKTLIKEGPGTYFNTEKIEIPKSVYEKYEPKLEDRYGFFFIDPVISFNSDDGLILGLSPEFTQHGFRADPFLYFLNFSGAYAFNAKDFDFLFHGDFHNLVGKSRGTLSVKATGIEFLNYFGTGNETSFNKVLLLDNYYRIKQKYLLFNPSLEFGISNFLNFSLGAFYEYSQIKTGDNTILKVKPQYGLGKNSYLGIRSALTFDSRNNTVSPEKGVYFFAGCEYYPVVFNNRKDFFKISGDLRTYFSTHAVTDVTLALRVGGQKVFGTYPFFKSAVLGGANNLRGFSRERFSGDASLFGQAEVRMFLFDMNVLLPGRFGLSFFGESGRVFVSYEESEKWHSSYGGGFWFSVLNNILSLNFSAAKSSETLNFYLISGVAF